MRQHLYFCTSKWVSIQMRQYLYFCTRKCVSICTFVRINFCANKCVRICAFRTSKFPLSRGSIGVGVPDEAARLLRQYMYFCNSKASKLSTWRSPLDHFRGFHTNSHYYCQRRRPASHRPADLKKRNNQEKPEYHLLETSYSRKGKKNKNTCLLLESKCF